MPYNVIQGIWEHFRGLEDTFEAIHHYFNPFRPNAIPLWVRSKYPKSAHDFFKVGIRVRMADIWPEICIWDVLDSF